ncbi:hypothetical protein ACFQT0_19445 [Hymenobacter humi]|uniref:YtxH domain-containing protein n=1 Tax=Hymenobacter humi TaxID=1411620 RepID=A0ABW2UA90_9BACT
MELFFKVLTALGVVAGIYNMYTSRTHAQQQQTKERVDAALKLGLENQKEIKHLQEKMDLREEATKEKLEKIGNDVGFVRDLFTKWLLDTARKPQ